MLTGFLAPHEPSELRAQAGRLPLRAPQLLSPGALVLSQAKVGRTLTGEVQNALGPAKFGWFETHKALQLPLLLIYSIPGGRAALDNLLGLAASINLEPSAAHSPPAFFSGALA